MHFSSVFSKIASIHLMPLGQSRAPGTLGCVSRLKKKQRRPVRGKRCSADRSFAAQLQSHLARLRKANHVSLHLSSAYRLCTRRRRRLSSVFHGRVHKTLNRRTGSSGARQCCQRSMHFDANLRAASGVFPLLLLLLFPQFQMFCFRGGVPSEAVEPSVVT